jgi:eukaryotic-like serine/threonine-protein kinase
VNSLILRGQCHEPHVTAERAEVLVLFHALPQIGFRLVREREFQVGQCLVALSSRLAEVRHGSAGFCDFDDASETSLVLAIYSKAESLHGRAAEIRRGVLRPTNRDTLESSNKLGFVLREESLFPEAEKLTRETIELRKHAFGPKDRDTLDSATQLALILDDEGRLPMPKNWTGKRWTPPAARTARKKRRHTSPGSISPSILRTKESTRRQKRSRDIDEADRKRLGDDNLTVVGEYDNLGNILLQQERYPEAEKIYRECLATHTRLQGPEHPRILLTAGNLEQALRSEKRYSEAETLLRDALAAKLRTLGPDHRSTLVTKGNLAETLGDEGKNAEAEQLIRETSAAVRKG